MDGRRLIDADDFVEWLLADAITDEQREFAEKVRYAAERMKPADAVPVVHGYWRPCHSLGKHAPEGYICSVCRVGGWEKTNICPHCGARNIEGDNES